MCPKQKKNVLLCEWNFREGSCKGKLSYARLEITAEASEMPFIPVR